MVAPKNSKRGHVLWARPRFASVVNAFSSTQKPDGKQPIRFLCGLCSAERVFHTITLLGLLGIVPPVHVSDEIPGDPADALKPHILAKFCHCSH